MSIDLAQQGAVATITMNAPGRRNALNFELRGRLRDVLEGVNNDASVRAVILTGAGVGFCAGADVEAMTSSSLQESRARMLHSHALIRTLYGRIPKESPDGKRMQMIVCSATLHHPEIVKLAEEIMHHPTWVDLKVFFSPA